MGIEYKEVECYVCLGRGGGFTSGGQCMNCNGSGKVTQKVKKSNNQLEIEIAGLEVEVRYLKQRVRDLGGKFEDEETK